MNLLQRTTHRLTLMGMMLAMVTALSALEHSLPPIPLLPPGIRLGLSNIVTMYVLFFIGRRCAILLAILKSLFVLLMRGAAAGFLSICGGLISIFAIILLLVIFQNKLSYLVLSVVGAIFHNLGQMIAASLLLKTNFIAFYLPALLVFGVLTGLVTGALLKAAMPMLDKMLVKWEQ